ncbi:MAG: hypothetical protein C0468_04225 [Planctomyces sp.]|nr:hypothetical protein [Planctomyces sp.]
MTGGGWAQMACRPGAGRGPRRGFTLVELLAAIAVIGVLIGLLAPALAGARESGRRAVCMSNVRQLVLAAEAYANDHRGRYAAGAPDFAANRDRWHGSRAQVSQPFRAGTGTLSAYFEVVGDAAGGSAQGVRGVRACPTFAPLAEELWRLGVGFERSAGGYGYNNAFVGTQRARAGSDGRPSWRVVSDRVGAWRHTFKDPSRTIGFADAALSARPTANAEGLIEYSFVEPRLRPDWPDFGAEPLRLDPSVHFRHARSGGAGAAGGGPAGVAVIGWLDGHVGEEPRAFTWRSGVFAAPSAPPAVGWPGAADDNSLYDQF